jgi:hypothetical protein
MGNKIESVAAVVSRARRLMPKEAGVDFIFVPFSDEDQDARTS